jgi:hypothetical protein
MHGSIVYFPVTQTFLFQETIPLYEGDQKDDRKVHWQLVVP